MKRALLTFVVMMSSAFAQDTFVKEAADLSGKLKSSLMKELQEKISKEGAKEAVPFCHANVKVIAKGAAKDYLAKYEFGRTSHKIRNEGNKPAPWMNEYLLKFKELKMGAPEAKAFVHKLDDGKKVYMEPLFVQPMCLNCHGEKVTADVKEKINALYPQDQATGFKVGDFRGFIWVKEK